MKWGVRRARQNKSSANNPRKKSSGGKVSTKKERKRLGISKGFEEQMIRDMIRYEAEKNNKSVSYRDVKASLKNDYRDIIELEEMDRY